ncbi:hypothetical protein COT42_03930 [Candidatus Saganbacteria bacterium CG08_land_8_20_14_0_20_45_16]|uniref:Uncharacterized protein n=1 Tax=Candidatus Saganbacteria bacterium CG08_land_8_20_14_0_20_45_16 TaxID=2014293 RepID=A0A2H0Y0G4_UNCSA|nr:MAG: hypothetical protein COT42_03930 [Candidatus Saganbacteria bacterium CG08_land_8_20_14_0_20_45_16]
MTSSIKGGESGVAVRTHESAVGGEGDGGTWGCPGVLDDVLIFLLTTSFYQEKEVVAIMLRTLHNISYETINHRNFETW